MEMVFRQSKDVDRRAKATLGPLKCWGDKVNIELQGLTFIDKDSMVELDVTFDKTNQHTIMFAFRTFSRNASVLKIMGKYFQMVVSTIEEDNVSFYINDSQKSQNYTVKSNRKLNDGHWQYVDVSIDQNDALFKINLASELVQNIEMNWISSEYTLLVGGFSGCIQNLIIDQNAIPLRELAFKNKGEIHVMAT